MVPTRAESKDPTKTPTFTWLSNSGDVGKANSPINRLIVKPIPQSSETPYTCGQVASSGMSASLSFMATQDVTNTPTADASGDAPLPQW